MIRRAHARTRRQSTPSFTPPILKYLMIVGAPDVVPHQDMTNPVYAPPDDDPDKNAEGDLPYACNQPYSRDIATFKGPTRVVGRLPDLRKAKEPSHLLALLNIAANYRSRNVEDFAAYFGLSTYSWRKSTELSIFNVFGNSEALALTPPAGPTYPARRLAPLAHFINCHGGPSDPDFYGEKGRATPPSLSSDAIKGKIKPGTVAAVECCYGAELYDLSPCRCRYRSVSATHTGRLRLFRQQHHRLWAGKGKRRGRLYYTVFPLSHVRAARRSAARRCSPGSDSCIRPGNSTRSISKTLGQFNLLGDPSIHPVNDRQRDERAERRRRPSKQPVERQVAALSCGRTANCCNKLSRPHRARPRKCVGRRRSRRRSLISPGKRESEPGKSSWHSS